MRYLTIVLLLLLAACKTPTPSESADLAYEPSQLDCGQRHPVLDFVPALDRLVELGWLKDPFGTVPSPSSERADFYVGLPVSVTDLYADLCSTSWAPVEGPAQPFALAGGRNYPAVRARLPNVATEAYAARQEARVSYRRPKADETAHLHASNSTTASRRQAIRLVETPDIMSAAAHLDLRDPAKVFFFARMIKVNAEAGVHAAEETVKARELMQKFAEQPIQINVFTKKVGTEVVIDHVECVDGNHRLAAGLISGKWKSIDDIPAEFLDIRVNGNRTADRRPGTPVKDLHWVPSRIVEEPAFKQKFREISATEFEERVRRVGRYDSSLLGENEYFKIPDHYGPASPSIAIRPEIPSNDPAMGQHAGVPMW